MPFCGAWGFGWFFPAMGFAVMLAFVLLVLRPVALALSSAMLGESQGAKAEPTARSAEEILRDRYARGEVSREQYMEALADVIRDYYVRGEITIEEFEARLEKIQSAETSYTNEAGGFGQSTQQPNL